jgi:hypothetical protein
LPVPTQEEFVNFPYKFKASRLKRARIDLLGGTFGEFSPRQGENRKTLARPVKAGPA